MKLSLTFYLAILIVVPSLLGLLKDSKFIDWSWLLVSMLYSEYTDQSSFLFRITFKELFYTFPFYDLIKAADIFILIVNFFCFKSEYIFGFKTFFLE
jgi:hypothetical protein